MANINEKASANAESLRSYTKYIKSVINESIPDNISSFNNDLGYIKESDVVTYEDNGLMIAADKEKLDNLVYGRKEGTVKGANSTAEGVQTTASDSQAHAEGSVTIASGNSSHAEGAVTVASGNQSHSEGSNTTAEGQASHAEGAATKASGQASHAEGSQTEATNFYSHAEGSTTHATGWASHAEGYRNTASGGYSHAQGYETTASGDYSTSIGLNTVAKGEAQTVMGMFNIEDSDSLLIVGNGTSTTHSNALALDKNGNMIIGKYKSDGTITYGTINGVDLTNVPIADNIPKNTSDLNNDSGFITSDSIPTKVSAFENDNGYITSAAVPTNVSALTNDSGYITADDIPDIPSKVSDLSDANDYVKKEGTKVLSDENYTKEEKDKLAAITNIMTIKSKVATVEDLPSNAAVGDVYFVGATDQENCEEYVKTETGWECLGPQAVNLDDYALKTDIPTSNSSLTNDEGYITSADIPTNISSFTNDSGYITLAEVPSIPSKTSELTNDSNYITSADIPKNVSDFTNDTGYITSSDIPAIPAFTSDLNNDSGFITSSDIPTDLSSYNNDAGFITSSDIPSIPSKTSDLTNDSGFITSDDVSKNLSAYTNDTEFITISSVPTKVGDLTNDAGYITSANIPTSISDFDNDSGYITSADIPTSNSAFTNDEGYAKSTDIPHNTGDLVNNSGFITSSDIPTNISSFTNDSGYITGVDADNVSIKYNTNDELSTIGLTNDEIKAIIEDEFPVVSYPDTYVQKTTTIAGLELSSDISVSSLKSALEINDKITSPTSGEVGQVLAIKTVSSSGTPTSWEAITYTPGSASSANDYVLPTATASVKGGITIGDNLTMNGSRLSVTSANIISALGYTPLDNANVTTVASSTTNGNIKINGTETTVYTHPGSGTNPHGTTKSDVGLGNVGNFKAVSTVASQGLNSTEQANARANIGAGTSSFSGNYNDLTNKPTIPSYSAATTSSAGLLSATDKAKLDGIANNANNYVHPGSGTNPHGTTKSDVGLGNVGNFKAVSTVASQGLSDTEKANARTNIGAGTSSFSGSYNDLTNKPTIPSAYIHPLVDNPKDMGLWKVQVDSWGHIIEANAVTKSDITALGIPSSDTNTWRGIQNNLTSTSTSDSLSAYQGKVLNEKFGNYLPLAGGTMSGDITLGNGTKIIANCNQIQLRTLDSYKSGIFSDQSGNECVAIWAKNSVTRLRWNAGTDMSAASSGSMMNITPDFEISKSDGTAKGYIGGYNIPTYKVLFSGETQIKATSGVDISETFLNFDVIEINLFFMGGSQNYFTTVSVPARQNNILTATISNGIISFDSTDSTQYGVAFKYNSSDSKLYGKVINGPSSLQMFVHKVVGIKYA